MLAEFMPSKPVVSEPGKPIEWPNEQIAVHHEGSGNPNRIMWAMTQNRLKIADIALKGVNIRRFRN